MSDKAAVRVAFSFNDIDIMCNASNLFSLTDMHRSNRAPDTKAPAQWRRKEGRGFIESLAKSLNVPIGHIYIGERGKGGATWAHRQVALAYAKYLSHEFHRFVNDKFLEWVEEQNDPDVKLDRTFEIYRRQGRDDKWIRDRVDGKLQRCDETEALKAHGVYGYGYAMCTDAINVHILGKTAKQFKLDNGLKASASTRDHMDAIQLTSTRLAELLATQKMDENNSQGNNECRKVCDQAGEAVSQAIKSMRLGGK